MKNSPQTNRLSRLVALGIASSLAACSGGGDCSTTFALTLPGTGGFGSFIFELRQDVALGGQLLTGSEWADFNGDTIPDLAELSSASNELYIGTGLVDGTFLPTEVLPTPGAPWSIASGDYNGDGRLDLAVGCLVAADPTLNAPASGQLALYLQDSLGDFALSSVTPLVGEPIDMSRLELGAGDLDSGSSDDLLVALDGPGMVQQLRLDGTSWILMTQLQPSSGGFEAATPLSLAVLDLGANGNLDILVGEIEVAEGGLDRVVSYRNDGFGGFMPAEMVLPTAQGPVISEAGDVDEDGFEDLAVAQLSGSSALLLRGTPGGLLFIEEAEMGGNQSSAVWSDFGQDGLFDVAASLVRDQAVSVRFQVAEGSTGAAPGSVYTPIDFYNVGLNPHNLVAADFAEDGTMDIGCTNAGDISILHNQGDRTFRAANGYQIGEAPRGVYVADLDQDGHLDAVTVDQHQKSVVFMQGSADGTFTRVTAVPLAITANETPGHIVIRDFDEDGLLDIMVGVFETGELQLLRNPGSMNFTIPIAEDRTLVGGKLRGLDAADFNGDEHWDVLVADSAGGTLQLLLGDGAGNFSVATSLVMGGTTYATFAGDLDADGISDGVVTMSNPDGSNSRLTLLKGDGLGGLETVGTFPLSSISHSIQVGDLNIDGLVDLVIGQNNIFTDEISVLLNNGEFGFSQAMLAVGDDPGSPSIADVDGDGDEDIVIPVGTGELRIALGDGEGGFPEIVPLDPTVYGLPVPFGTRSSTFADINQDGLKDLLMVSVYSDFLWVARNLGTVGE